MRFLQFSILMMCAAIFCGCEKQAKLNSEKLDQLTAQLAQQELVQSNKLLLLQAQLALLAPQLDKETSEYFEKNRDAALFFHTNTLFLLLTIDKHIEAQLQSAVLERAGVSNALYNFHTNEVGTALYCAAQVEETMQEQLNQLQEKINAESARLNAASSNALMDAIKTPAVPTADDVAWRKQIQGELAALRHEIEMLRPAIPDRTNLPTVP